MKSVYVRLRSTQEVQAFVEQLTRLPGDFDLVSDGYILDARSLMGIFSLDLTKPLQLNVHEPKPATFTALERFMAPGQPA